MSCQIIRGCVYEDSGASLMARVTGSDGSNIEQADLASITKTVIRRRTGETVASGSLTVADVVFDSLQTDDRWSKDSTGYNFRYEATAAESPTGGEVYVFEFKFTPNSGQPFHVVFELSVKEIRAS